MNAIAAAYALGFAFFLGYARGHDSSMPTASWAHAFYLAAIWPLAAAWFAVRRWDGTSHRFIALAFLLLSAALPARATFSVTIATAGPVTESAIITSDPAGITCPGTCTANFVEDSTVTLTEVHPSTMGFLGWGGDDGCKTNRDSCQLTLAANANVTATFAPTLDLYFSSSNPIGIGVVTSSAAGITGTVYRSTGSGANGAPIRLTYPLDTELVLTQSTGPYSAFLGWTASAGACSTADTCTITLTEYTTVVATFTASAAAYPLKVAIPNGGGTVTSSPAGISCPGVCSSTFTASAAVTLTTAASSGYRFAGWANGGCRGLAVCVVTSTSPLQGQGGKYSPAAFFYPTP